MVRYKAILGALGVTCLLTGCGKKIDFGSDEGITMRDERNQPMGAADPTDWTSDGSWSKTERALFHFDPAVDLNGSQQGGLRGLGFFPNPVSSVSRHGIFILGSTPTDLKAKLVIVDQKYKVLLEQETSLAKGSNTQYAFNLSADKFPANKLYRLYYVYYTAAGTLYYKGHGDIKIADQ
jgi:hypothetical protein